MPGRKEYRILLLVILGDLVQKFSEIILIPVLYPLSYNTENGRKFWNECSGSFFAEERSVEEAVKGNAQLNHPTPAHPKRAEFEILYKQKGFEEAVQICLQDEIKQDRKKQEKIRLRRKLRKIAGIVIPRYRS